MAQKNRANMLTDIVNNIYNNLINFITGQNAQDRFVNLLDSSPNILSDASQPNGYVSTDANNEMFSSYYDEEISRADLITDLTANLAVGGKFYRINDAVGATITLLVIAESNLNLYPFGIDATTGEVGVYDITTDVFAPVIGSGNASITSITVAALTTLQSTSAIATTTIYLITDASPFVLAAQFKANNQNVTTATIMDNAYAGTVLYTASTGVSTGGRISDANGNVWNGTMPSATTLGASSVRNTFEQDCSLTAGTGFADNVVKSKATGYIFGNGLIKTTIEAGPNGADYTNLTNFSFLYGNSAPCRIFNDGTNNYHWKDDPANNRIIQTLMVAPYTVSYIGGVTSVSAGTNISVTGTSTAPIINSLSDRYSTSSTSSNTIDNGNGKIFTVDANLAYIPLQEVLIVNSPSNHMHGTVVSYSGTTLTVDINSHTGSAGPYTSWVINLDGTPVDAITGVGTANEIAYFTGGQVIGSLPVATYPTLTELALVKGVSGSDIQTQINGKMTNPMTTGGDVIYGGASGAPTRLANGTAGQILQSNGTTLAPSWVAAPSGTNTYAFNVISQTLAAPLDATSYHFGLAVEIPASTTLRREFKFPQAGTMTAFSFNLLQVTNGSNETCTLYLRNTTTSTDYTIGTFTSDFGLNGALKTLFSGLSIAVNTTDNWAVKILTPTWGTNPTSWIPVGIISITT